MVKNPPANAGDIGLIPGSERSSGDWNGNPLQYFCLGNPRDRGAWWTTVHGVAKSQTWLSHWARVRARERTHTHIHTHTPSQTLLSALSFSGRESSDGLIVPQPNKPPCSAWDSQHPSCLLVVRCKTGWRAWNLFLLVKEHTLHGAASSERWSERAVIWLCETSNSWGH